MDNTDAIQRKLPTTLVRGIITPLSIDGIHRAMWSESMAAFRYTVHYDPAVINKDSLCALVMWDTKENKVTDTTTI